MAKGTMSGRSGGDVSNAGLQLAFDTSLDRIIVTSVSAAVVACIGTKRVNAPLFRPDGT
jgi:hypothetical protein